MFFKTVKKCICERLSLNKPGYILYIFLWSQMRVILKNVRACANPSSSTWVRASDAFQVLAEKPPHYAFVRACVQVCARKVRIPIDSIDLFTLVSNEQGQLAGLPLETLKPDY